MRKLNSAELSIVAGGTDGEDKLLFPPEVAKMHIKEGNDNGKIFFQPEVDALRSEIEGGFFPPEA